MKNKEERVEREKYEARILELERSFCEAMGVESMGDTATAKRRPGTQTSRERKGSTNGWISWARRPRSFLEDSSDGEFS